jgi:predicted kinase
MEVIVLVGLPGAGKTTFYRSRFAGTHEHVSKDNFSNARDKDARQASLITEALARGRSVVVDNTNARISDRRRLTELARQSGARTLAYVVEVPIAVAIARNASREGRARVPKVAIFTVAKRLEPVTSAEDFDEIYRVWLDDDRREHVDPVHVVQPR